MNTLIHHKGKDTFVFRYEYGDEAHVQTAIVALACNPAVPFDAWDAAVISHEMGVRAGLHEIKAPSVPSISAFFRSMTKALTRKGN